MQRLALLSLGLAAASALLLALAPSATQSPLEDALGSQICTPESIGTQSLDLTKPLLASLSAPAMSHATSRQSGPLWQKPRLATFDPESAKVELELKAADGGQLTAGKEARAILRVSDKSSGLPFSSRSVAGWMLLQRNAQVSAEMSCNAKAKLFAQGNVTTRPDVDLNENKLLILSRDGTISMVNPQIDFTITQMEKVIPLPAVPADWRMSADGGSLFVSLPVLNAIAVVDISTFAISNLIELDKATLPTQLIALPDGRVAAYLMGIQSVAIADPAGIRSTAYMRVGKGRVSMATDKRGGLYIATSDGTLSAIDTLADKSRLSVDIDRGESSIVFSDANNNLFISSSTSNRILVLNPLTLEIMSSISAEPGISAMAMEPEGQLLVAINRMTDKLLLIDPSKAEIIAEETVARAPVELSFSSDYAYVRGLEGDHFSVIDLANLRSGKLTPVNIQSASRPVHDGEPAANARLVAPYGHGALVANLQEQVAYYYMEGMNSPMGTVKTYGPNVIGLMSVNKGFRETSPGTYETTFTVPRAGRYDIPVTIDEDRFVTCFSAVAAPASKTKSEDLLASIRIEQETPLAQAVSDRRNVVLRIVDTKTNTPVSGLKGVRLLAFSPSGGWQSRKAAVELGDGRYSGDWRFPKSGRYGVSVSIASLDVGFADQPPIYLKVEASHPVNGEPKD
jgi:hypothetical protein